MRKSLFVLATLQGSLVELVENLVLSAWGGGGGGGGGVFVDLYVTRTTGLYLIIAIFFIVMES